MGLVIACGSEDPPTSSGGGSTGVMETSGEDSSAGPPATGDSGPGTEDSADDTAGSDTTDTGEPLPPPPATGIEIVEVTADQGIRIPIALGGELLDPGERNGAVLQGRPLVLRAFYETDPGYANRDIYAVLFLQQTDGSSEIYESFINTSPPECDGEPLNECRYGSPTGSFVFRLEAQDVRPGATYRISMFETSPGHEDDVSDKSPIFPAGGGSLPIGVEDSTMKMRVVVVPFDHDLGPECPEPPDLLEELGTDYHGNPRTVADYFGERLLAQNPADEVEIIVHDVVPYYGNASGGQGLLNTLQSMRFGEGAPPGHYYYGVIRPCGGGPDFSGIAQLGGPTMGEAAQRVGWGVYHQSVATTAETFVHEIGHEQGRLHVRCSGDEAGVDTSYPDHPEGDTESWGIDVLSNPITIKPPSSHDYMTYCGSTWVSEWGWHLVSPWIETISSWEASGAVPPRRPLLVGTVREDGSSSFYRAEGWFEPELATPDHTVRFFAGGRLLAEQPAQWVKWERSEDYNVIVPLPVEPSRIEALSWHEPGRSGAIDRSSLEAMGLLAP